VPTPTPLEPDAGAMRAMAEAATAYLIEFIESRRVAPAADLDGAMELAAALREPAPRTGQDFESLLGVVAGAAAKGFDTAGPGYLAFIPGGGLFSAALADYVACGINRFVGIWNPAPVLAQIEWQALRWFCDLFDYPAEARGILTSGGSMANFSAIVTARADRLPEDFLRGTLYTTDQTHASVAKAAALAGFPAGNVRTVPRGEDLRMDIGALRRAIDDDRAAGYHPFCLVASAGTTNTGAIDPIDEAASVAGTEQMWLHVDGAYGGFFQLTDHGRTAFAGIERADSIVLDPHKGMFLPYGTGALLVRDGTKLRSAHQVGAHYLQDLAPEGEIPNFADYSPELSRDFRGLRVWLPVKLHGFDAFRAALEEKLRLARFLHAELKSSPGFDVPWDPELTVVAFRYLPHTGDANGFNQRLLERINASRRVFLSSTMIDDLYVLRACIVSHRTHHDRVAEAADIIRAAAAELEAEYHG
jgi:aromatic-L-amino-acid decarboxylase